MIISAAGEYTNDITTTEGIDIDSADVVLTNSATGRIVGGVRFLQGESTVINAEGGIVRVADGQSQFLVNAVTGSAGDDTFVNYGLVSGLVQLGDGNDRYVKGGNANTADNSVDLGAGDDVLERTSGSGSITAQGGAGTDRVVVSVTNGTVVQGGTLSGFELLELNGSGQLVGFSGYSSITLGSPSGSGHALISSLNPTVDLALVGNDFRLANGTLNSITGNGEGENVELTGAVTAVAGAIDLGGGDDKLTISRFGANAQTALPGGGADGGAGDDTLMLVSYSDGSLTYDLATLAGFERLNLNAQYVASVNFDLTNVDGFLAIDLGQQSSLTLRSSQSPGGNLSGGYGGTIILETGSTIGRYGPPLISGFDQSVSLVQGDDTLSVDLINRGQVRGDVRFYIGDDFYDGTAGSVSGTVFGNAGNDLLLGSSGSDTFEGGYGFDQLYGNAGNDILKGDAGNDTLASGVGYDTLIGGEGDDELYFGAYFSNADYANGGTGYDTLSLQGTYGSPLTFGAGVMLNIEKLLLMSGNDTRFGDTAGNLYSYNLRTVDANVAPGQIFTVNASALRAGETLIFDGSAETNASFAVHSGAGADMLIGGARGDTLNAGAGADVLRAGLGFDTLAGGDGDDQLYFGGDFSNADYANGGTGNDTLYLQGIYGSPLIFGAGVLHNIEKLVLMSGSDTSFGDTAGNYYTYNLRTSDESVAGGQTLTVDFSGLGSHENVIFGGRSETNGSFLIYGGLGDDTVAGGAGNDVFTFGAGRWDPIDDTVDGGGGSDRLSIQLAAATNSLSFRPNQVINVEAVDLLGTGVAGTHTFLLHDDLIDPGLVMTFAASAFGSNEALLFDGSAETDGRMRVAGGAGHDTIIGGKGADFFTLGSGDTLIYNAIEDSNQGQGDMITFASDSLIDLSRIDANALLAGDQAFTFIGTAEFSGEAGELRFLTGDWVIRGDVNGDGISDFDILISVPSVAPNPIVIEQLFVL